MPRLFIKLLVLFTLNSLGTWAQAPGSTGPAPGSPAAPAAVPLDGGASLLLAGGAAYGLRHLRRKRTA